MRKPVDPVPNFNRDEVAFNVEAARSYLFSAALHMLEGMQEQNIQHGDVAIMTGAVEFAAQLWIWTALRSGVPPKKARETAEREFRTFLRKHMNTKEQPEEGKAS